MNENHDRLMDLLMEEVARKKGPPNLRTKIVAAAHGEPGMLQPASARPPAPATARLRLMPLYTTMLAAALIVGVLLNINYIGELVTRAIKPDGARSAGGGRQSGNQPPALPPTENSRPATDAADKPAPPAGDQPNEQPRPIETEPEPRKPDEVKKPAEPPPEDRRPEGVVEEPRKQEPTTPPKEAPPSEPVVIATVLGKPKLKLRYADTDPWSEFDGALLKSGVQLQARGNVDLSMTSGALLRFDGEVSFSSDGKSLESSLIKDSLYFDNRGCNQPVTVVSQKLRATLADGAALFTQAPNAIEIACLEGEVVTIAGNVAAGSMKRLSARGLGAAKPFALTRELMDIPTRLLLREDFEKAPAGGMYGGKISEGSANATGHGEYVAFRFNPTLTVMPRVAVKMRLRVKQAKRLQLEMFEQGYDQPWLIHLTPKQGEWVEVTVTFDELRLREKPDARLGADTLLRNFKLYVEGEKDASLEIDWIEFVRLGPR